MMFINSFTWRLYFIIEQLENRGVEIVPQRHKLI